MYKRNKKENKYIYFYFHGNIPFADDEHILIKETSYKMDLSEHLISLLQHVGNS
jgi:hypothetical protein